MGIWTWYNVESRAAGAIIGGRHEIACYVYWRQSLSARRVHWHMVLARTRQYVKLLPGPEIICGYEKNTCSVWSIFPVTYINSAVFRVVLRKPTSRINAVLRRLITYTSDILQTASLTFLTFMKTCDGKECSNVIPNLILNSRPMQVSF
jgi:hypothetical protein